MKIKSGIAIFLIAVSFLVFSSWLSAEVPGGQTIAAGFEKQTKVRLDQDNELLFDCRDCTVPACLTVQKTNDSQIILSFRDENDLTYPLDPYPKEETRTDCHPRIAKIVAQCIGLSSGFGGDRGCEFHWRLDLIGNPMLDLVKPNN